MPPHDPSEYLNENNLPSTLGEKSLHEADPLKGDAKKNTYPFVDLVRFIATIGIVFIHTEIPLPPEISFKTFVHQVDHVEYYLFLRQLFKFSTICYFLISGFLLADKTISSHPFDYYKRRLNVIAKPYVLALLLFVAFIVISNSLSSHQFHLSYLIATIKYTMFYTAFWYIPNYFICLLVIVCFYKYVNSLYFGGILLLTTLCYTYFNVYSQTYTSSHTTALFGFVFYLWLGVYIKQNNLISHIKKASPLVLGFVMLIFLLLGTYESFYLLKHTQSHDSLNTLRISNQLYSLAVFTFLVRCCGNAPKFGIFNPRKETYGIYLYHGFFSFFLIPMLEAPVLAYFKLNFASINIGYDILIIMVNFLICYLATTMLVKVLLRFKLAYLPSM